MKNSLPLSSSSSGTGARPAAARAQPAATAGSGAGVVGIMNGVGRVFGNARRIGVMRRFA